MVDGMTGEAGLRERKKAATRAALSQAAWSLMLDGGLDAATPEAIAEAAEVSPRTFRNYFSSREEAILDELARRYLTLVDRLRNRPPDEPVWDSLTAVASSAAAEIVGDRAKAAALMRVVTDSPAMRAQLLLVMEQMGTALAELIAERTGADPVRDLPTRLMASTVGAALGAGVGFWARGATDAPLAEVLCECLARLRAGLPLDEAARSG